MKRILALILMLTMLLVCFAGCGDDEDDVPTRVVGGDLVTPDAQLSTNPDMNINNAWSDNYYAMFTYYCPAQGYDTATVITERKTQNSFIISNPMDSSFKYYTDSEAGLEEYAVNPGSNLFTYNKYQGKIVSRDINTMFMNISLVTENFSQAPDVVYTGTEAVANRNCWMYLQRTYTASGDVDKVAYIWIDAVYGFCAKCITYSGGDIVCSWELQDFSVGTVTDADVAPDLTAYNFTQS